MEARLNRSYIGSPEFAAARGLGESGRSAKGENGEKRGLVEGLNPRGALTAIIISADVKDGLRHTRPRLPGRTAPEQNGKMRLSFADGKWRREGGMEDERDGQGRLL